MSEPLIPAQDMNWLTATLIVAAAVLYLWLVLYMLKWLGAFVAWIKRTVFGYSPPAPPEEIELQVGSGYRHKSPPGKGAPIFGPSARPIIIQFSIGVAAFLIGKYYLYEPILAFVKSF